MLNYIFQQKSIMVGPSSVGYRLSSEALVFGGQKLTATDVAVAAGFCDIEGADKGRVQHLSSECVTQTVDVMKQMVEHAIDQVKV